MDKEKIKENIFLDTLNSLSQHIAVIDNNGEIIYTNNAWNKFATNNIGMSSIKEVGVGANYFDVVKTASKNDKYISEIYKGLLAVGKGEMEYFYIDYPYHSEDTKRWYTLRATPIKDTAYITISHDNVTNRVLAEKEVLKSLHKLELISNVIGEVVYKISFDESGNKVVDYVSNNINDVIGIPINECVEKKYKKKELMRPNEYDKDVALYNEIKNSKVLKTYNSEYEWYHKKLKKWVWLSETRFPEIKNEVVVGMFGKIVDITEIKQLEIEERKVKELLELISTNIGEVVYKSKFDKNGKVEVEYISDNIEDLFGFDKMMFKEKDEDFIKCLRPESLKPIKNFNKKVRTSLTNHPHKIEYEYYNKTKKRWLWMQETVIPEIENGKVISLLGKVIDITEQKINEQILHLSEERYQRLFNEMSEGLLYSDSNGQILLVNPALCKMLDYEEEDLIGQNAYKLLLLSKDFKNIKDKIKAREKGISESYNTKMLTKNGIEIPVRLNASPLISSKAEFSGIMTVVNDVTEKQEMENILESIFHISSTHGGVSYFTEMTNELCKLLGVKYVFIGKYISDTDSIETLGLSKHGNKIPNIIYETKNTPCKITLNEEYHIIEDNIEEKYPNDPDIHEMGIDSYIGVSLIRDNKKIGIIALLDDKPMKDVGFKNLVLTNIKQRTETEIVRLDIEILLKAKEERFRGLVENTSEITTVINPNADITYITPSVTSSLGYSEKELIGKSIFNYLHPEDIKKAEDSVKACINDKEYFNYELYRMKSKDKKIRIFRALVSNHLDKQGIKGFIINAQDITDLVQAEKDRFINILKAEENERTRIAHDLHDGLGQTIAAANMCMNTLEKFAKKEFSEQAYSIFKSGKKLVGDATKETRLVSHNIMPPSLKEFGVEQSVEGLINNYKNIDSEIKFDFNSNVGDKRFSKEIELTSFRLVQEALSNAIKYSKANNINVELRLLGKRLFLNIVDNGKGFNLNQSQNGIQSGLGLSSMKDRIKSLGGHIDIKSELDKGTHVSAILNITKTQFEIL